MPATLKCTNCGGDLHFTPQLQRWKCEWCDKEHTEQDLQGFSREADEALNKTTHAAARREESDDGVIVTYKCAYCGAEVVTTEETAATFCVYCQRPVTILSQVSGEFKPSFVLPFKNTREHALEQFRKFLKGKRFLPKDYRGEGNLQKLTGVYIPFWLFNGTVNFDMSGEADIVTTTRRGDYRIIKTDTYRVARAGHLRVEDVPVDASSKTSDDIMDSIEPFDFADLKPFATPYLSGFLAERYDLTADESVPRAKKRADGSVDKKINSTLTRYTSVRRKSDNKEMTDISQRYGLLPVWMLHTIYKNKDYTFAMNGQTGKFIGNLPMAGGKIARFAALVFAGGGILGALVGYVLRYLEIL